MHFLAFFFFLSLMERRKNIQVSVISQGFNFHLYVLDSQISISSSDLFPEFLTYIKNFFISTWILISISYIMCPNWTDILQGCPSIFSISVNSNSVLLFPQAINLVVLQSFLYSIFHTLSSPNAFGSIFRTNHFLTTSATTTLVY